MTYQDDRTEEQKQTHRWLVVAKDKFMSGWGGARGGASWCGWACRTFEQMERLEKWVRDREEMRYVSIRKDDGKRIRTGRSCAHFHLYVADETHPALG